jgi:hypothetical protein
VGVRFWGVRFYRAVWLVLGGGVGVTALGWVCVRVLMSFLFEANIESTGKLLSGSLYAESAGVDSVATLIIVPCEKRKKKGRMELTDGCAKWTRNTLAQPVSRLGLSICNLVRFCTSLDCAAG